MPPPTRHEVHSSAATLYFRGIPRGVKDLYKSYCARRGLSMQQDIENYMRKCIDMDLKNKLQTEK
jgi:hypothetical protein